jgi:ATP-dependent DNA helicase PIF1
MRQDDPVFIKLLSEIRLGTITKETQTILNTRLIENLNDEIDNNIIKPTKLYPHKKTVENINIEKLQALIDEGKEDKNYISNDFVLDKKTKTKKMPNNEHLTYLDTRIPKKIKLAVGAQVMLVVNLDFENGLVNGSRGIITKFIEGYPVVLFDNNLEIRISCHDFKIETDTCFIFRHQIPLILAWALTIHKCQGSTISRVITNLQDIFCDSQGYVTLSRVRSLDGLFLININYKKLTCNKDVIDFYKKLEKGETYDKHIDPIYENDLDDSVFNTNLLL